jgi:hypothetical protein
MILQCEDGSTIEFELSDVLKSKVHEEALKYNVIDEEIVVRALRLHYLEKEKHKILDEIIMVSQQLDDLFKKSNTVNEKIVSIKNGNL